MSSALLPDSSRSPAVAPTLIGVFACGGRGRLSYKPCPLVVVQQCRAVRPPSSPPGSSRQEFSRRINCLPTLHKATPGAEQQSLTYRSSGVIFATAQSRRRRRRRKTERKISARLQLLRHGLHGSRQQLVQRGGSGAGVGVVGTQPRLELLKGVCVQIQPAIRDLHTTWAGSRSCFLQRSIRVCRSMIPSADQCRVGVGDPVFLRMRRVVLPPPARRLIVFTHDLVCNEALAAGDTQLTWNLYTCTRLPVLPASMITAYCNAAFSTLFSFDVSVVSAPSFSCGATGQW